MLRVSISNGYMLKNYVARFTTILPPAGLKLTLQSFLQESKNRGEWGGIYCHQCTVHFLKAKSCIFLFLEHREDRSFKNSMLNSSFKQLIHLWRRYLNRFIKLSCGIK